MRIMAPMTAALLLVGAPGTGKSSVLTALANLLEEDGVGFGAIELEQLTWGDPPLGPDVGATALRQIVSLQGNAGRSLFLIAATPESSPELEEIIAATGTDLTVVVCLAAPPDIVAARIAAREPDTWTGKRHLIERSRHLAATVPLLEGIEATLQTGGREALDVARDVRALLPGHADTAT
jgi:hypothetical protein